MATTSTRTRQRVIPFAVSDWMTVRGLRVEIAVLKAIQAGTFKYAKSSNELFNERGLFDHHVTGDFTSLEKNYVTDSTPNWATDPVQADQLWQELEKAKRAGEIKDINLSQVNRDGSWSGYIIFAPNDIGLSTVNFPYTRITREQMICDLYVAWMQVHLGLHPPM